MFCQTSSTCGRFECLYDGICKRSNLNLSWLGTLTLFPIAVGIATASSFGSAAVQIFMLMLVMNFGRKVISSLYATNSGIFLANALANSQKKHPSKPIDLVDFKLVTIILPVILTGLIAGIHMKNFAPQLFLTIFFVGQMLVLIYSTSKKHRELSLLERTEKKVNQDSNHRIQSVLVGNVLHMDDGFVIDFDEIFKLIAESPDKELYLEHLPDEFQDYDLNMDEHLVKAKDYFISHSIVTRYTPQQLKETALKLSYKPQNKSYIYATFVIVFINVFILVVKGFFFSNSQDHCHDNYWGSFGLQLFINSTTYSFFVEHQKIKDIIILYVVAFMGGFCLGFIGVGTALFLVLALNRMNISEGGIRSISATLPLILSIVTGTGALIQILMGSIDGVTSLLLGALGYLGQKQVNPVVTKTLESKQMLSKSIFGAGIFQKFLLVAYLVIQAPKILTTPFWDQITPKPYCLNI